MSDKISIHTPIHDLLTLNEEFNQAIEILFASKPRRRIILKALEELSELSTKLLQKANKDDKVSDASVLKEIIDVQMNIILIQKLFTPELIRMLVEEKVKKFLDSEDCQKYFYQYEREKEKNKKGRG